MKGLMGFGQAAASLLVAAALCALVVEPDEARVLTRMTRYWMIAVLAAPVGSWAYAAIRRAARRGKVSPTCAR